MYRNDKPHATAYIAPVSASFTQPQNTDYNFGIVYSSFQRPLQITKGTSTLQLKYGVDDERIQTTQTAGAQTEERLFLGAYEKQTVGNTVNDIIYIEGDAGTAAMIVNNTVYAVYTDYLGSILKVYNEAGSLVAEQNFDAWGRKRNPANWNEYLPPSGGGGGGSPEWLYRGYTGHEHLAAFGLINMNARMYDPLTGRMLSPDNYVQAADYTQSYNRYAYCYNNPFVYTDPDGNNPIVIAAIIIGSYLGGSSVNGTFNPTKWDYSKWQTYAGIVVGGAGGWAGAALGAGIAASAIAGGSSAISAGIAGGMVGGMASGAINGAGMTAIMGGSFNDILMNMSQSMIIGGFSGALSGGVGAAIGDFSGVVGSPFKNALYEFGHSTLKGFATGLAGGAMVAAMEQDANYLWKGAAVGAAFGFGMAGLRIMALGTTFIPDPKTYGTLEDFGQAYRQGSIFMKAGSGITLGRNVAVKLTGNLVQDRYLLQHETGHLFDLNTIGVSRFYSRILKEYAKYGFLNSYKTPGTLEYRAQNYSFQKLGYYFRGSILRTVFP